ncbi:MAG: RluA family pseudouridine synthase [Lachnospiraceae bacterium]|nr:RluA family pseudouridine synthase [Lachnospiraceae bacterium]
MERILSWNIKPAQEAMTIKQFLRTHGCSHHVLTHLKRSECGILLNGAWAYTNQKLQSGDELRIRVTEEESSPNILPVPMNLDIVYEDEDLMILNKPSDTPIHPSVNNHENTLANGVMYYFAAQKIPFVYRCINRLDRDTSGLLIVAKNMFSGAVLSQMSAARQIHREYLAIAEGLLPASGTIDAPIARMEGSALMRCVDHERGENAVTHYTCIRHAASGDTPLSLARVHLETGRTHQIRVHMSYIGHPLIGDFLYHPASAALIPRQALHSYRLRFLHPVTGKVLDFTCDMPEDMQSVL